MHFSITCSEHHSRQSASSHRASGHPGSAVLPENAWLDLAPKLRLSPRELQIVRGVFEDHKEEVIAFELGISPHTVNTYFQRLYAKLGVSSRPQLILCVMQHYLALASLVTD